MSFWDNLQKNMNKAAQSGVKTTSKWLEIGKLNMALNAAKMDLSDLYEQIGEMIYQNKMMDISHSQVVQELFHEVTRQKMKIKEIQAQISQVREIRSCEQCGEILDETTKYCPYCSAPQSDQVDWRL